MLGIAQPLFHTQHDFLLIFVKFHDFQRQLVVFCEVFVRAFQVVNAQLGDGHQSLDLAFELDHHSAFEHVRNAAVHGIAHGVGHGQRGPGIFNGLFVSQRDALAILVDIEHDNIQFRALFNHLARMANALRPRHIGNMHQPVDPLFDFDKRAKIGQIPHHASKRHAGRVFDIQGLPRIRLHLLETQRDFLAFLVHAQDHHLDLIAGCDQLGGMADVLRPRHFRNVY